MHGFLPREISGTITEANLCMDILPRDTCGSITEANLCIYCAIHNTEKKTTTTHTALLSEGEKQCVIQTV